MRRPLPDDGPAAGSFRARRRPHSRAARLTDGRRLIRTGMFTALVSILYYIVIAVWSLAYFVFMLLLFAATAAFDRERVALHKASRVWARSIFLLNPLWRLRVEGRERVARDAAYVVTVNHQSMLDIPLMYVLPHLNFKWVAKSGVYRWPLFGVVLWLHGDITVDERGSVRKTMEFMNEGKERLAHGTSVVIFPEGTRSRDGEIHNFKEGAFRLAEEAGVDILPCVIDGAKTFMNGWRTRRNTFTVKILPPVPAARLRECGTRETMKSVREATVSALAEIRNRSAAEARKGE